MILPILDTAVPFSCVTSGALNRAYLYEEQKHTFFSFTAFLIDEFYHCKMKFRFGYRHTEYVSYSRQFANSGSVQALEIHLRFVHCPLKVHIQTEGQNEKGRRYSMVVMGINFGLNYLDFNSHFTTHKCDLRQVN